MSQTVPIYSPLILIGFGKHAQVVLDALGVHMVSDLSKVLGYIDDKPTPHDLYSNLNLPYLGDDSALVNHKGARFVVCVGDNEKRKALYEKAESFGLLPCNPIIHPTAYVAPSAQIGGGSVVMAGAVVQPLATVGFNCIVNTGATIDHNCIIQNHVHIAPGVHLAGTVRVHESALVGIGAAVVPDIEIGAGAAVAAGSVVYKNIPALTRYIMPRKPRPLKVLIFAPVIGRGGVHRMVERLTAAWADYADLDRFTFKILSQKRDEIGLPVAWPDSFEFEQLDPHAAPKHPDLFPFLFKLQAVFYKHLKQQTADIIWLPMPWWSMRVPTWDITTPVIPTIPDFAFDQIGINNEVTAGFRHEARMFARLARAAVFPSDYQRIFGESQYGFNRTATIHYAEFLPKVFNPTPEESERVRVLYDLPDSYVLGFHVYGHKDPKTILKGQALARSISADVPPLVLGGIETDRFLPQVNQRLGGAQDVQAVIKQCGYTLGRDLFIVGQIPDKDIGGLYAGASAVVTASISEGGLSGTIYEAMTANKPLVFSDLPVFTERLGLENEYGLHFKTGNPKSLGDAIAAVYADPEAAARRVLNALAFVQSRTWRDVANDYLTLFSEVAR